MVEVTEWGPGRAPGQLHGDRGQVVPLLAVVVLVALGAIVLGARLGGLVLDRHRAQRAADAAALAAVEGGRLAAERVAGANGARVETFVVERVGAGLPEVVVVVRVGDARATARAGASAVSGTPPPGP